MWLLPTHTGISLSSPLTVQCPVISQGLETDYVMKSCSMITVESSYHQDQCQLQLPDANYKMIDVSLEYEIVTQSDLARHIMMEYQIMVLPYNRVLRDRQIPVNKSDTT